jgi:hypothetical protein
LLLQAGLPDAQDHDRPTPAINAFVAMQGNSLGVIKNIRQQVFARKILCSWTSTTFLPAWISWNT